MHKLFRGWIVACLFLAHAAVAMAALPAATLYKTPGCTCCDQYVTYLRANGFSVKVVESTNMDGVKKWFGSDKVASCHSMLIGGYVVEGHVPVAAIRKMLAELPHITGIAVPGMPDNAPGMGPEIKGTLKVVEFVKGQTGTPKVFAVE